MNASTVLDRLSQLGVTVTVDDSDLLLQPAELTPPELVAEVKRNKPELLEFLRRAEFERLREEAFRAANKISDWLGVSDPLARGLNRLGWLVCDLEDAGFSEAYLAPLREEKQWLGREWNRQHGG